MSTQSPTPTRRVPGDRAHAVPGRAPIVDALEGAARPVPFDELAESFSLDKRDDKTALSERLQRMQRDGHVLIDRRGRYALPAKMNLVKGRVVGHADGYGFVIPDDGGDDLYLAPRAMRRVLHGDRVLASIVGVDRRGRREGKVVEVIDHARHVVGRYFENRGAGFVEPDDRRIGRDIVVAAGQAGDARNGQIVVAEIIQHPIEHRHAVVRVVEILGDHMAPGMEVEIAIRKYELPHEWRKGVARAAAKAAARDIRHVAGRLDLRNFALLTIDGADARDFDDAVYCEPVRGGWRLVVAIADVSYYVEPGTELDREAFQRGNSVYFPNRVLPMLPEALSNGSCSLNPDEDRLCTACEMRVDKSGAITSYRFREAIMRSRARLTYTEVAAALVDRDADTRAHLGELLGDLEHLHDVHAALDGARTRRGSIDFEFPEPLITFDAEHKIESVTTRTRNVAHRIIEECMLAANVCAAQFIARNAPGAVYRVHDGPAPEALNDLRRFLSGFGLSLGGGERPDAGDYAATVQAARNRPEIEQMVQTVLLRSLTQAVYSAEPGAHFALGYDLYTHFTSPIRRYPDLIVHRLIKAKLARRRGLQGVSAVGPLSAVTEHCSFTDRRADDATRDVTRWLKAEFMLDKIGDKFSGVISGVTAFGLFVQLDEIFVEGLVHVSSLGDDYYEFDPLRYRLMGQRTARVFRLGERLSVKLMAVNLDAAKIDFELSERSARSGSLKRGAKRSRRGRSRKAGR